MQCILTRSDIELYFGGEMLTSDQPQSFTCPYCKKMGFSDATLLEHVSAEHTETSLEVVCPVCAGLPGGEPNLVTDDFAGHLTLEHRQGPRELISFLISFSKHSKRIIFYLQSKEKIILQFFYLFFNQFSFILKLENVIFSKLLQITILFAMKNS